MNSNSNITQDVTEWLKSVSSYQEDKNITSQIKNVNQASGFVLDHEKVTIVEGVPCPINFYQMNDIAAVEDLISHMAENGHKIYPHALVKSSTKNTAPEDIIQLDDYRKVLDDPRSNEEQRTYAESAYNEYYEKLSDVDVVIFTAVVP